jgi:hypothetical protein
MGSGHLEGKPKVDAAKTIVLDEDEIAELDESSLTSIMRDASRLLERLEADTEPTPELDTLESGVPETDD